MTELKVTMITRTQCVTERQKADDGNRKNSEQTPAQLLTDCPPTTSKSEENSGEVEYEVKNDNCLPNKVIALKLDTL